MMPNDIPLSLSARPSTSKYEIKSSQAEMAYKEAFCGLQQGLDALAFRGFYVHLFLFLRAFGVFGQGKG